MRELNIEKRKEICETCPIFKPSNKTCNPNLWINPDTDEVSTYSKTGFIRGCGCAVMIKMRNVSNHCIAGKW